MGAKRTRFTAEARWTYPGFRLSGFPHLVVLGRELVSDQRVKAVQNRRMSSKAAGTTAPIPPKTITTVMNASELRMPERS